MMRVVVFFSAVVLSLIMVSLPVFAWDFTGERKPLSPLKMPDEYNREDLVCDRDMRLYYKHYKDTHPDFPARAPEAREDWRFAFMLANVKRDEDFLNYCALGEMLDEHQAFEVSAERVEPIFCGVPGENLTIEEKAYSKLLEHILALSLQGSARAGGMLLNITNPSRFESHPSQLTALLPEVRFYVQELQWHLFPDLMRGKGVDYYYTIPDDQTGLTEKQMADIREAVKRGDSSIVLNEFTTCGKEDL